MFFLIGFAVFILGCLPLISAIAKHQKLAREERLRRYRIGGFVVLVDCLFLIAINVFFSYFTDLAWFRSVGYQARFWRVIGTVLELFGVGASVSFALYFGALRYGLSRVLPESRLAVPLGLSIIGGIVMGVWLAGLWQPFLLYMNRAQSDIRDPVFGHSVTFYLFTLDFFTALVGWLVFAAVAIIAVTLILVFVRLQNRGSGDATPQSGVVGALRKPLLLGGALLLFTMAFDAYLGIARLLFTRTGVVTGAGWTDVHVRQVTLVITVILYALTGLCMLVAAFSSGFMRTVFGVQMAGEGISFSRKAIIYPAIFFGYLIVFNAILPDLIQTTVVAPNEITLENKYIANNIHFTRQAYDLQGDSLTETTYNVGSTVSRQIVDDNEPTMNNVRLWDWRALLDNLRQQQEIRLYYSFPDVDVDRYTVDGKYQQMMVAVRELDKSALAPESQTWVSRHFKYTHGYGIVMTPVHSFLSGGRPKLLIKNIPPETETQGLKVTRPEIYYGELTNDHVYVDTNQQEFNYPSGNDNVYNTYEGRGGVPIGGFIRRFIFAWKFDGYQQLFSSYLNPHSRIMYNRNILQRAETIAPFLRYDNDPYAVLTDSGRIKYVIDAYTTSSKYPYSEMYRGSYAELRGVNYIRNSVKVVIDAYDGSVDFYAVDPNDIILKTYENIFPDLFKPLSAMPADLQQHLRYPQGLMTVQAEIYATYHMTDVATFYQREDVWQFATERYRQNFQTVEPYYAMVQLPGDKDVEFVLMVPFTPKDKNVMNAWMAGRSDMPNYGKLIVYAIPKGVEVLGPRQIEARVDQNTEMSRALSLWSQQGSQVIRGNMLAIPLFRGTQLTILFAEPIFLQAEDAQLPELKRIVLADQNTVVWADQFSTAVDALVNQQVPEYAQVVTATPSENQTAQAASQGGAGPGSAAAASGPSAGTAAANSEAAIQLHTLKDLTSQAVQAFDEYKSDQSQGNFEAAGSALDKLNRILGQINQAQ